MRFILSAILALAATLAAPAAEKDGAWNSLAGMDLELEGETLELRDELIAGHMSFLSALEAAAAEASTLADDDPRRPRAWARVEHLLETSYRLLASAGEHEAFLKATAGLIPEAPAPAEPAPPGAGAHPDVSAHPDADLDGGLMFEAADGAQLLPKSSADGMTLIDAVSGEELDDFTGVAARAISPGEERSDGYVPLIKARAAWLRALALEKLGRTREAKAEVAGLGMIVDWAVLGPLESDSDVYSYINSDLESIYNGMSIDAVHPGKNGPARWRPLASVDPLGRFMPGALFRGPGANSAVAVALVRSDADGPATLRFGASAPAVVSVNHFQAVIAQPGGVCSPDQEIVDVWLRRGLNVILVRTASAREGWDLAVRLTAPDGNPFPGQALKPDAESLGEFLAAARQAAARSLLDRLYVSGRAPDAGGISILSRWTEDNPGDARGNFYLASLLVAKRLMEGAERFDREAIFRRAIDHSGGDPYFTLMAARAVDSGLDGPEREENLRLVLLKQAADQGSAAALADMGRLYLDVMRQPRRAHEYAEVALSVNPMSLRAGVLDYDAAVAMGWDPVAGSLLERLALRHPSAAAARLRLGRAALAGGRYRQALTEFHAILGVQADNREALDGAVVALGMLGQTSAAVDLLLAHMGRFPYDSEVRLKLAELYRTLGRDDDARSVLTAALRAAPDDREAENMLLDIHRETYAEGKTEQADVRAGSHPRQELDLSPPAVDPPNGWEYLYFQTEDRMERSGAINRTVSFAVKIHTARAARLLRHLGFWLERGFESGSIRRIDIIRPDGGRIPFSPPPTGAGRSGNFRFYLPPLGIGMVVEAEVEIRRERVTFLGDYFGQIAPLTQQAPVRLSRYIFTAPADKRVFFRPANGAPEAMVVSSPDGTQTTRIWEMTDLPAFVAEPYSPGADELAPCVQASSFDNWDEFARWYWRLIGAQYHVPPELRELADSFGSRADPPIARLDEASAWVARTIGHREWEYGPYAFRPINARSILSRLSADSKDRTLLVCLLAREYGLQAWPVLTRLRGGGFAPVGSSRPGLPLLDHFNYSLAMVDTDSGGDVFLDASNPYRPSGVMPSQLFGGPGIAVTPEGAESIVIPDGGAAACEWDETAELIVDEDGSILWEESVRGTGTAAEMLRMRFGREDEPDGAWHDFLVSIGGAPSTATGVFADAARDPASAEWRGRARLRQYAVMQGDRVILTVPALPGGVSRTAGDQGYPLSLTEMAALGERTQDLVLPHGFRIVRRLTLRHPEEWRLVNVPEPMELSFPFGGASLTVERGDGSLSLTFAVETPGHLIKADDYRNFREMAALAGRWLRPVLVWEKQ